MSRCFLSRHSVVIRNSNPNKVKNLTSLVSPMLGMTNNGVCLMLKSRFKACCSSRLTVLLYTAKTSQCMKVCPLSYSKDIVKLGVSMTGTCIAHSYRASVGGVGQTTSSKVVTSVYVSGISLSVVLYVTHSAFLESVKGLSGS
jgi:hypothetical protein